jgi:methionyl-tRNA formyltransferase
MPSQTRIVMLGTGDFAVPTFRRLLDTGHNVVAIVTQPDRPQGRKQELIPAKIKQLALERGVPVLQPEQINLPEGVALLRSLNPEILITAAYGQILSSEVLKLPVHGGLNLHGSILPSYRGAAPVARAIQNGETTTGVTVIRMSPRVDAGGMIAFAETSIDPQETAGEVEDRLATIGAPILVESLAHVIDGTASIIPQDRAKVTKAPKLSKEDGRINWSLPAISIHNLVRAMNPWPLASTHWRPLDPSKPSTRLIVHRTEVVAAKGEPGSVVEAAGDSLIVATAEGGIRMLRVQPVGKKPMLAAEFLRGNRIQVGDRMGDD